VQATAEKPTTPPNAPPNATFPAAAYEACLTDDQVRAVRAFESLATPGHAVVAEADRGRGKSSAAGIAAGALALSGADVLVTAPAFRNAAEVFARASELIEGSESDGEDGDGDGGNERNSEGDTHRIDAPGGGGCASSRAPPAADLPDDPDAVIVDEAAALPVRLLEGFLDAPAVAFCTTVHGYEGAGRGFAIRFKERLRASPFAVRDVRLDEPIRYARNDPVEAWASRALLLDARPAVDEAVAGSAVGDATYRRLTPDELLADEALLREAFGLLVAAHYRTEPNDLARLLDAPNLAARALVAEGGWSRSRCSRGRAGSTRKPADGCTRASASAATWFGRAHEPAPRRDRRRAVWPADGPDRDSPRTQRRGVRYSPARRGPRGVRRGRREGHGRRLRWRHRRLLLGRLRRDPRLLRFWRRAGYRTVHLSTSRNDASGEHSAIMLRPTGEDGPGSRLLDRHAAAFRDRERDGSRTPTATWTPMWSPARFEPVPRRCRST